MLTRNIWSQISEGFFIINQKSNFTRICQSYQLKKPSKVEKNWHILKRITFNFRRGRLRDICSQYRVYKVKGLQSQCGQSWRSQKKSATLAITAKVCARAFNTGSTLPCSESFSKFEGQYLCSPLTNKLLINCNERSKHLLKVC